MPIVLSEKHDGRNLASGVRRPSLHWTVKLFIGLIVVLAAGWYNRDFICARGKPSYEQRALKVLESTPLVDGHNDLAILVRQQFKNHINNEAFSDAIHTDSFPGQFSFPSAAEGRYGGAFWSAFWPCQKDIFDFSDDAYSSVLQNTNEQLDLLRRLLSAFSPPFPDTPTSNVQQAEQAFKKGRLISPLIIEGLHQIGNRFSNLRHYYDLGVRYATLNWNCHNIYSDAAVLTFMNNGSSLQSTPYWGGISQKGRQLIYEMNRLGMIIDLSHVSADTMRDVLAGQHNHEAEHNDIQDEWDGSLAPPIFSHSSAYAVCPHPRNVPDDVLHLVKKRDSVVMINFSPDFISCTAPKPGAPANSLPDYYPQNNTLQQVVNHIKHIGELIGYDHVGIGTDFDGIQSTPKGLEDVSKFPGLVAELLKQGVSDHDAGKVVGGNVLRVWREVERVSKRLQNEGKLPAEDDIRFPFSK